MKSDAYQKSVNRKAFLLVMESEFIKRKKLEGQGAKIEIKKSKFNPFSNSAVVQKIWQQFEEEYQNKKQTNYFI